MDNAITRKRRIGSLTSMLMLAAAIFSAAAAAPLAFASGGYDSSGNTAISDNDQVAQTNAQSSSQTATIDSDNKLNNGGSVSNTIGQSSGQSAANVLNDNDFYMFK
jgi:hypothetical protein